MKWPLGFFLVFGSLSEAVAHNKPSIGEKQAIEIAIKHLKSPNVEMYSEKFYHAPTAHFDKEIKLWLVTFEDRADSKRAVIVDVDLQGNPNIASYGCP